MREGWGSRFTFHGADGTLERTEAGGTTALRYQDHGVTLEAPTGRDGYFAVPSIGSSGIVATASGEVWLKTFERSDTLVVYHAVRRGDMTGEPRRVLLPESISFRDATDTHVWGIWKDSLGVPHVVGRRLVAIPRNR